MERKNKERHMEEQALSEAKIQSNKPKIDVNSQKLALQRKERILQQYLAKSC